MNEEKETSDLIGQRKIRIEKTNQLRELGINPYPSKSNRTHKTDEIISKFDELDGAEVTVVGRLMSWRGHGQLVFTDIQDQYGRIQLYIKSDEISQTSKENQTIGFENLNLLDIGDIVEANGTVTKTQRGEISILVKNIKILTKALRPLPSQVDGIKDRETILRKRYLDTIINPEKRKVFEYGAKIVFAIREFLNGKGFLEIQTPIIQPIYGGGTAKPFTTHVNALGMDYYLAIAHELYLKRLITAGFENVYNIAGYFRNEGIDRTHNPQFNMLETMTAFQNYEFNMDLIEEMYKYIGEKVFGKTTFKVEGQEVDFGQKWERIQMIDAVKKYAGYDFNDVKDLEHAHRILDEIGFEDEKASSIGEVMVQVFEEKVEEQLIQPTFVYGHPVEISPLAKTMDSDPRFVERFEIFIGGIEGGDNWTELNDPVELYARFKDQVDRGRAGQEEFHPMDVDFLETMEHGMPPTTGLGPGIERLIMMFTEEKYIDDVMFFPMMKRAKVTEQQKEIYGEEYVEEEKETTKLQSAETQSEPKGANIDYDQLAKDEVDRVANVMSSEKPFEQDKSQKAVIVLLKDLQGWQLNNTISHIAGKIGAEVNKARWTTRDTFKTADGEIPANSMYPIVTLKANSSEQLYNLLTRVEEEGLIHLAFTQDMIDHTDDNDLQNQYSTQNKKDLQYLGIGFFGPNDKLKELTKKFSLWG